jgi:signal transduction histidine kinase
LGRGNGLKNLRQRLEKIGGRCEIQSTRGTGTEIKFFVSVPAAARESIKNAPGRVINKWDTTSRRSKRKV